MEEIPEQYVRESRILISLEIRQASDMVKLLLAGNVGTFPWLIGMALRAPDSQDECYSEVGVGAAKAALNIYSPWLLSLAKYSLFNKFSISGQMPSDH